MPLRSLNTIMVTSSVCHSDENFGGRNLYRTVMSEFYEGEEAE